MQHCPTLCHSRRGGTTVSNQLYPSVAHSVTDDRYTVELYHHIIHTLSRTPRRGRSSTRTVWPMPGGMLANCHPSSGNWNSTHHVIRGTRGLPLSSQAGMHTQSDLRYMRRPSQQIRL